MSNIAFVLLIVGVSLLYCEFIWLGKLVFGVAGAILALGGLAIFWRIPHTAAGLEMIGGSIVCFALEAAFQTYFLGGIAASALLAFGFWQLCPYPLLIRPELAFPLSAIFGAGTTALLSIAKRARQNKRADV